MPQDLDHIERELQKRLCHPYEWGRKQNDVWDRYSNFIYTTRNWKELLEHCAVEAKKNHLDSREFLNYSANRWYNFWSAVAVETIFTGMPGVTPHFKHGDRLVDFRLFGLNFDHKTSIFPKGFGKSLKFAQQHPGDLITWLYQNQSSQQRHHYGNRLFLLVYAEDGNHWKLKAEISWLKSIIEKYVSNFDTSQLVKLEFLPGRETFSDIIWAIK